MPSPAELTRRAFLGSAAAGVLGAACRRSSEDASLPPPPPSSDVAILAAPNYDHLTDLVSRGLRELRVDLKGRRVLLKPNLVEFEAAGAINTHPLLIGAVAEAVRQAGALDVLVAEGPGHRRDLEYLVTATGLSDVLRDVRVRVLDLNLDDVRRVPLQTKFMGLDSLLLPVSVLDADVVISLPKLKTHHWVGMTCAMKNLFGVVPGAVYGWPKNFLHFHGIDNAILDLTATLRPQLTIVDAIVAMEGDGPIMGVPRASGFLVMGRDPVAVDATCARAIGIEPDRLRYLATAGGLLGNAREDRIRQIAEPPSRFRYEFAMSPSMEGLRSSGG
jgi:uncharacterized protein (DUF362 family)